MSDGHLTDTEEADHAAISHEPAYIREIEVLKECLKKQVRKVLFFFQALTLNFSIGPI